MKYRASTNQLGCVGWVHPKPLPTEYGSLMGFAWGRFARYPRGHGWLQRGPSNCFETPVGRRYAN